MGYSLLSSTMGYTCKCIMSGVVDVGDVDVVDVGDVDVGVGLC